MDAIKMVEFHEEFTRENPANQIMLDAWTKKRDELFARVYR